MAKKPKPRPRSLFGTVWLWSWSAVRNNPFTSLAAIVAVIVGIPGIVTATVFVSSALEPTWIATHSWVREWGAPIIKVQNTQSLSIDRFLLYQQQQAIAEAKRDPAIQTSPNAQERLRQLEDQANDTKLRICKTTSDQRDCK